MIKSSQAKTVVYSSEDLPERDRFNIWCEMLARKMAGFDIAHHDARPFYTEARFRSYGSVRMSGNTSTSMLFSRSADLISADGIDSFGLPLSLVGTWEVAQGKRRLAMNRQTAALIDLAYTLEGGLGTDLPNHHQTLVCLCLPRDELLRRVPKVEKLVMQPFSSQEGLDLLINYLTMLAQKNPSVDINLEQMISEQILDIVAFICRTTSAVQPEAGGIRVARKAAILRYLQQHFREPGLSVADIAAALKISRRYLYELLDDNEETVTQTLNRLRLEWACRLLNDPDYRHLSIVEIAFQSGFNDLSYFYRQFRRCYGETPGAFRKRSGLVKVL